MINPAFEQISPPPTLQALMDTDVAAVLSALRQLTASAEPAVVFTSLAAICATTLSDECRVYIEEDGNAAYQICQPTALPATPDKSGLSPEYHGQHITEDTVSTLIGAGTTAEHPGYRGLVVHRWHHRRPPTALDAALAQAAVDQAEALIIRQRLTDLTQNLRRTMTNLQAALDSNREIGAAMGILMATHRISQSQAFDLLRAASQCSNRKLRDVASEVVFMGMLDPTVPQAADATTSEAQGAGRRGQQATDPRFGPLLPRVEVGADLDTLSVDREAHGVVVSIGEPPRWLIP